MMLWLLAVLLQRWERCVTSAGRDKIHGGPMGMRAAAPTTSPPEGVSEGRSHISAMGKKQVHAEERWQSQQVETYLVCRSVITRLPAA